jgi:hypothetical protein
MDFIGDGSPSSDLVFAPTSWCVVEAATGCRYESSLGENQGAGHMPFNVFQEAKFILF